MGLKVTLSRPLPSLAPHPSSTDSPGTPLPLLCFHLGSCSSSFGEQSLHGLVPAKQGLMTSHPQRVPLALYPRAGISFPHPEAKIRPSLPCCTFSWWEGQLIPLPWFSASHPCPPPPSATVSFVQSLSRVCLFATAWTAARQASLSITNSQSLLKLMSIESVLPSNHLILCRHLLLPPSIFSSRLQSFPASGSFPMSQFFASGGQRIGVSASASVLPNSESS